MDKLIKILACILCGQLLIITITIVAASVYLHNKCVPAYDYIDMEGNSGIANVCYTTPRGEVCRGAKRAFQVQSFKQSKVCKNDRRRKTIERD